MAKSPAKPPVRPQNRPNRAAGYGFFSGTAGGALVPLAARSCSSRLRVEAFLQHVVHVVGDAGEMRADRRSAGGKLEPGEVQMNALALDFIVGDGERVRPGPEGVFGAQRLDAVVGLGDIGGQREVLRIHPGDHRTGHRAPDALLGAAQLCGDRDHPDPVLRRPGHRIRRARLHGVQRPRFLDHFDQAMAAAPGEMARLRALVSDNPGPGRAGRAADRPWRKERIAVAPCGSAWRARAAGRGAIDFAAGKASMDQAARPWPT